MSDGKGDGPYTHGNSFANGPGLPPFARDWQFRLMREAAYDRWAVQA